MAGFFSGFLGLIGCGKSAKTEYKVADIYQELREGALRTDPVKLGLKAGGSNRVWGVLMEMGSAAGVITLATISDGAVSLYFSNGGGIIGIGEHEEPRKAGLALVSAAPEFLKHTNPATTFPLPEPGHTRFYFMTYDGILAADTLEDELGKDRSPLSPLFFKAQEVITQARIASEKREESVGRMLHAATTGDAAGLKALLDSGMSTDVSDRTGLTPLMASAYAGKTETLTLLLASGAKVDKTDASGYTALTFASNAGQKDCAELLIVKGADVEHRENDSSTPIMFAAQHAHDDVVRLLLSRGADPAFEGKHGLSAIGFARQNGHAETERILMRR